MPEKTNIILFGPLKSGKSSLYHELTEPGCDQEDRRSKTYVQTTPIHKSIFSTIKPEDANCFNDVYLHDLHTKYHFIPKPFELMNLKKRFLKQHADQNFEMAYKSQFSLENEKFIEHFMTYPNSTPLIVWNNELWLYYRDTETLMQIDSKVPNYSIVYQQCLNASYDPDNETLYTKAMDALQQYAILSSDPDFSFVRQIYQEAHIALYCIDLSQEIVEPKIKADLEVFRHYNPNATLVLIGTKVDLLEHPSKDAQKLLDQIDLDSSLNVYEKKILCSSIKNIGIHERKKHPTDTIGSILHTILLDHTEVFYDALSEIPEITKSPTTLPGLTTKIAPVIISEILMAERSDTVSENSLDSDEDDSSSTFTKRYPSTLLFGKKSPEINPDYPNSYTVLFYQRQSSGNPLLGARSLLNDYTKGNTLFFSTLHRYASGHINRHYVDQVTSIVKQIDRGNISSINDLIALFDAIPISNFQGSLARRIAFIKQEAAHCAQSETARP